MVNCVRLANALAKAAGIYVGSCEPSELAGVISAGQTALGLTNEDLDGLRGQLVEASMHDPPPAGAIAKPS
jgi:hypothetical protein